MSFKQILLTLCTVGVCLAPGGGGASAQSPDETTALTECLKDPDSSLSVLFLVDTSQSLAATDPAPGTARVKALQGALHALDKIAKTRDVYVDFAEFGSKAVPSFPGTEWAQLEPGTNAFVDEVAAYEERHDAEDTDYADAVGFALGRLAEAPVSCQLVAWFTDGMLDIDYQQTDKTLDWAVPPIVIDEEGDEVAAEDAATHKICDPGGINDQLRGSDAYLAAVGFNQKPNQFGLLERIAQGSDCGELAPRGKFVEADDDAALINGLVKSVDPADSDSAFELKTTADQECAELLTADQPGSFRVPGSVNSMRVRIDRGNAQVKPILIAPRGSGDPLAATEPTQRINLNETPSIELADGAALDVTQYSDTLSSFELTFPDQVGAWNGPWELRLCTDVESLVGTAGLVEVVNVGGGVGMTLQSPDPTIRKGMSNELVGQLTSTNEFPRGEDALGPNDTVEAHLGDLDVAASEVAVDGTVRFEVTVPDDYQSDSAELRVAVQPAVEVLPAGKFWQLEPFDDSIGTIVVKPAPTYPVVSPPGPFAEINQQALSSVATLEATSVGEDAGGEVQLISVELETPEGFPGEPSVRVIDANGDPVSPGDTVAALADGDTQTFTVEVSTTEEQSRINTKVPGTLKLVSTSSVSPGTTEEFNFDFNVRIDPIIVTENPASEVLTIFVLLAILLPLALLYLYNGLWGARLDFVPTPLVTLEIVTTAGVTTRRGDGGPALTIRDTDVKPLAIEKGRYKRLEMRAVDGSLVEFHAHISPLPWGEPAATTRVGEFPVQYGQLGTARNRRRGRTGLNMTGAWAVALASPEQDGGRRPGVIVILPGRGNEIGHAQRILDEAAEVLLKAYNDGQLPEPEPEPEPPLPPSSESVEETSTAAAQGPQASLDDDLPY